MQAQEAADALVRGDFDRVVALTHPALVEAMGGRGPMIAALRRGQEEMTAEGKSLVGATTEKPLQIVRTGRQLQCVVPQTLEMLVAGGTLEAKSALIGVSVDGGVTWRFVAAGKGGARQQLESLVPDLSRELRVPEYGDPVFRPDND